MFTVTEKAGTSREAEHEPWIGRNFSMLKNFPYSSAKFELFFALSVSRISVYSYNPDSVEYFLVTPY